MKIRHNKLQQLSKGVAVLKVAFWASVILFLLSYGLSMTFASDGANELQSWVNSFSSLVGGLIGVLAIIMIISAGIIYVTSQGESKQIGLAKDMIISAISGVALFMLAGVLLNMITTYFGGAGR